MKKTTTKPKPTGATKPKPVPNRDQSSSKTPAGRPKSKPRAPSGDGGKRPEAVGPSADAEEVLESLEESYRTQCEESEMPSVPDKPLRISLQMIARRNLPPGIPAGNQDRLIQALGKLTHLRLDRENIGELDNLEMMGPITNLYLQQNEISKIENLESLQSLHFLTLANNRIERVENLNVLLQLRLLDLSSNRIQKLRTEELPRSLLILNLKGNPCTELPDYRKRILLALPSLRQLDGEAVTKRERLAAGCKATDLSSDEEEEEEMDEDQEDEGDELTDESSSTADDVLQLSASFIKESRLRSQEHTAEHYRHMEQLVEARSQSQMAMNSARSSLAMTPRSPGGGASALASGRLSAGSSAWR